jgi:hypothetical protein
MRALYVSAFGKKQGNDQAHQTRTYDLFGTYKAIASRLTALSPQIQLTHISDLNIVDSGARHLTKVMHDYDAIIVDVTTSNFNVGYMLGNADALGRPTIVVQEATSAVAASLTNRDRLSYEEGRIDAAFIAALADRVTSTKTRGNETGVTKTSVTKTSVDGSAPQHAPRVFISYCHKDKEYTERLLAHLRPLQRRGLIDPWSDLRLQVGDRWRQEIEHALKAARIAVLMVSADFLASEFIVNEELPPLLAKADAGGTRIAPLIVMPCGFVREPKLKDFQAFNDPNQPLSGMTKHEAESLLDRLAADISREVGE